MRSRSLVASGSRVVAAEEATSAVVEAMEEVAVMAVAVAVTAAEVAVTVAAAEIDMVAVVATVEVVGMAAAGVTAMVGEADMAGGATEGHLLCLKLLPLICTVKTAKPPPPPPPQHSIFCCCSSVAGPSHFVCARVFYWGERVVDAMERKQASPCLYLYSGTVRHRMS